MYEGTMDMAFATFEDMLMVDELQLLTGLTIRPMIAPLSVLEKTLEMLYRAGRTKFLNNLEDYRDGEEAEEEEEVTVEEQNDEILNLDEAPPPGPDGRIVRMVNQILEQALRSGASDIHLEPFEDSCAIRLRVDGSLRELPPPPLSLFVPIVSRFKILAKMDIAEKRVPQDGAIALRSGDKRVDLRVSTVPTVYGEKMVMRILDKGAIPIELTGLGFDERQSKDLDRVDPDAPRPDAGHRADRQRQEHHALRLPEQVERAGHEHLHGGRPRGVQVQGDEPGPGQDPGGADLRRRAAGLPAARPGRHHGRRSARPGDGPDLSAGRP